MDVDVDPADFYTGIVAEMYAPLKAVSQEAGPYAAFVREAGSPALELGCGDGDPLLALRQLGLDVEGVDSSADMLTRCRRRAKEQGVEVVVHHQRMEALDLPRRYRAVFLAGPTFNLLADDAVALAALRGIRSHLAEGGTALVPLFVPSPTPAGQFGRARTAIGADGAELRVSVVGEERDEEARTQVTVLRYERRHGGVSTAVDRDWVLHWYPPGGFEALAAAAGLTVASVADTADGGVREYRLRAAD
ncbi:Class I SAM-dependent methyltransferase [Actinacidiphila bryophytorum]|uniref:Class I SAM-dependent methyltransferase n=1 Tax=Actinacidiphila bryophytorum TaxID=1436133 RepID=A0A9W4H2G3_9ACTN|nr:Class I SAM-dependent methyltransferase [Actinacidiphila bryophytorum]